jgi:hypothetical protein
MTPTVNAAPIARAGDRRTALATRSNVPSTAPNPLMTAGTACQWK